MTATNPLERFFEDLKEELFLEAGVAPALEPPAVPPSTPPEDEVAFYPGSTTNKRKAREERAEEQDAELPTDWDGSPRTYNVRGVATEFFPISALARALNRSTTTMRKWETKGWIPEAIYRSPGPPKKQDRLYTREQIAGLQRIAADENLMEPRLRRRVEDTRFPDRARALFEGASS